MYAAVELETIKVPHTTLEPTTIKGIAHASFSELREKHDVDDAVFLINGSYSLKAICRRHGLDLKYGRYGNRNGIERIFRDIKSIKYHFLNCFSNAEADIADNWLRFFAFARNQLI